MISLKVTLDNHLEEELALLLSLLSGPEAETLNERGGSAARDAAVAYHEDFDKGNGWRGKRYLGPSQGEGGNFGSKVADGWSLESVTSGGAVIANDADHYAFKVRGGTITPKRAKALTIPIVPEAKGVRVANYQQNTGRRLFQVRGKQALFERIDSFTSGARGRRGQAGASTIRTSGIRAVYLLLKSVTMGPWSGAVPPESILANAYTDAYREGLEEMIKTA